MVEQGRIKNDRGAGLLLILAVILAIGAVLLIDQKRQAQHNQQIVANLSEGLDRLAQAFRAEVEQALGSLDGLAQVSTDSSEAGALRQAAELVMASNAGLATVRYVDETGRERFHLARTTSNPQLPSAPALRSPSVRAYDQDILALAPGQTLLLAPGLNAEPSSADVPNPSFLQLGRRLPEAAGFWMVEVAVDGFPASAQTGPRDEGYRLVLVNPATLRLHDLATEADGPWQPAAGQAAFEPLPKAVAERIATTTEGAWRLPEGGLVLSKPMQLHRLQSSQLVAPDDVILLQQYRAEALSRAVHQVGYWPLLLTSGVIMALALLSYLLVRRTRLHLEQAGRLVPATGDAVTAAIASKAAFMAHMSHEIKTPMTVILGMLGLLKGAALDAQQTKFAGKAYAASERLLGTLDDMLEVSRLEAQQVVIDHKPFELDELIETSIVIHGPLAEEKGVSLAVQVAPETPVQVSGDLLRFGQILSRLVSSAIKFSTQGDSIGVTFNWQVPADGREVLQVRLQGRGIEMAGEQVSLVVEALAQGDAGHAGYVDRFGAGAKVDLGLTLAAGLTERLGGKLTVASAAGTDSLVTLELPVGHVEGSVCFRDLRLPALELLLFTDLPALTENLTSHGRAWSLQITQATSSAELLQLSEAESDLPKLVVLDVVTQLSPELALEVIHGLGAGQKPHPVAVIAIVPAGITPADRERLAQNGTVLITQPLTPHGLFRAFESALKPKVAIAEPLPPTRFSELKVLVVDDLEMNIEVISELLGKLGIVAMAASSGEQAINIVTHHPVDLVLMDVHMGGMSGLTATQQIRQQAGIRQPLIFGLSASAMAADRDAALAAGMEGYLNKPLILDELTALFKKHRLAPVEQSAPAVKEIALADTWPFPEFIDRVSWESRFGRNTELLSRCLNNFASGFDAFPSRLDRAERCADAPDAHTLVHKLLGVARNLGDDRLAATAGKAEAGLAANSWAAMPALKALLIERLAEVKAWAMTALPRPIRAPESPAGDRLRRGLSALRANEYMGESDRLVLLDYFRALGGSEHEKDMKEALESFDYSRANALLNELLATDR